MSEEYFQIALEEIESDRKSKGLWAQCFAETDGDEARAKAAYIKKRAKQLSVQSNNSISPVKEFSADGNIKWHTIKAILITMFAYALSYFAIVYYYFLTSGGVPAKIELYPLIPTAWVAVNLARSLSRQNGVNELLNVVCLLFIPVGWIILFFIPARTDKI